MEKKTRWGIRPAAEWEEILKTQRGSHLSVVKFCREQDINYKQFLYVRGKIRKNSGRSLVVARSSGITRSRGFIPISLMGGGNIRLRFPHGLELTSDELPPSAWVVEVTRSLVGGGGEPC
ncbi:hypothetical protein HY772_09155 [Candidatus Woesearchaeota archaeon]|nr:hypothetical protein [Candidatus Woesearchaeota archaeon]